MRCFAPLGDRLGQYPGFPEQVLGALQILQLRRSDVGPANLIEGYQTPLCVYYFNQGIFFSNIGRLEESIQSLEKSLAARPSFEQAQVKLEQVRSRISERRPVSN